MRARSPRVLATAFVLLAGCGQGSAPKAPTPSSAAAAVTAGTLPASTAAPAVSCRPASEDTRRFLAHLQDGSARQPLDVGATSTLHQQLFRVLPSLHTTGYVRTIVPTQSKGAHGPVFALTIVPRRSDGTTEGAALAFATARCPGGEPELLGAPVPLGAPDAAIVYANRVLVGEGAPLTELVVDVADHPMEMLGAMPPKLVHQSILVGDARGGLTVTAPKGAAFGVVGIVPSLDTDELDPATKTPRARDEHMLGTGWYPLGKGAALLLVHQVMPTRETICRTRAMPHAPAALRVIAKVDTVKGFVLEPGAAWVVGFAKSPPQAVVDDARVLLRGGPLESGRGYTKSTVQWLWGLFPSAEEARAEAQRSGAKDAMVLATEPPAGAPKPKEPFVLPSSKPAGLSSFDCDLL